MRDQTKKPVLSKRYDLEGNTLPRIMMHWLRIKTTIMGNYSSGPGLRCMVMLWILHYLGGPIFRLRIWLSNQHRLRARLRRVLTKLKGR